MFKLIKEGKIKLKIVAKPVYEAEVFYNPEARLQRDISVAAISVLAASKKLSVLDALAGTGVRGLRYAKEIGLNVILNDKNPQAYELIRQNISINALEGFCVAKSIDANALMQKQKFDIVDLDPFGSPACFLDSAARSARCAFAVTATDTATLCGKYPTTCLRKYSIITTKTHYYTEVGLRALVTFVIFSFARWSKAFIPKLAHISKHYYRVYGQVAQKSKLKYLLKKIGFTWHCDCNRWYKEPKKKCECGLKCKIIGPIYLGKISDRTFCHFVREEIIKRNFELRTQELKLIDKIIEECELPPFYYDLSVLASKLKISMPKIANVIKELRAEGYKASRTHLCNSGLKTDADYKTVLKIISKRP